MRHRGGVAVRAVGGRVRFFGRAVEEVGQHLGYAVGQRQHALRAEAQRPPAADAALTAPPRWYLLTARLCSSSEPLKWLLPSPRATKYSAFVCAGCTAAINEALPGMAIGVGGRPARV